MVRFVGQTKNSKHGRRGSFCDERKNHNPNKDMENRICQADRREENTQSAVSCIERGSERSRENQKERLQYLAAGTAGTTATQGAGYGAIADRACQIVQCAFSECLTAVQRVSVCLECSRQGWAARCSRLLLSTSFAVWRYAPLNAATSGL